MTTPTQPEDAHLEMSYEDAQSESYSPYAGYDLSEADDEYDENNELIEDGEFYG